MPSEWIELSIETPPEYVEPLSEIFYRYGEGGVAVEQPGGFNPDEGEEPPVPDRVTVKTYIPKDPTTDRRRAQIDVGVRLVAHLAPVSELRERPVSEDDWRDNWKEFFHVLRVGRRVVICPTWRKHDPEPDDVIVHLDPGMAFGTGHHPTTRMCIEIIERIMPQGARVLDLGCGSAILSIAARKLGAERVVGFEIDPIAAGSRTLQCRNERTSGQRGSRSRNSAKSQSSPTVLRPGSRQYIGESRHRYGGAHRRLRCPGRQDHRLRHHREAPHRSRRGARSDGRND